MSTDCHSQGCKFSLLKVALVLFILTFKFVVVLSDKSPSALTVVETTNTSNEDEEADLEDEVDPEDLEVFQPTNQWQTLRADQAVPVGSHVRLNLQTGQREVKLGEDDGLNRWKDRQRQETDAADTTSGTSISAEELKKALKKMKEGAEPADDKKEQDEEVLKARFRSMDELKQDMKALDMLLETDFQIMTRLVGTFNSTEASVEERVSALHSLEYLVHQVDNAQSLVSMGGMRLVIDALNSSDVRLQESAAFVLGSAVSSNPTVQVEAVEDGALQKLLTLLATQRPMAVKKKVLFAVASILRHFPFAQNRFLKLGGVQVLGELFRTTGGEALRVRIVALLYDMIVEKELMTQAGLDPIPDASHQERLRQYAQFSLLPLLAEQGWCGLVPELLASPEHDWREKALRALLAMMPRCRDDYRRDDSLADALRALQEQYRELALTEQSLGEEDGYFGEILELLDTVVQKIW